MKIVKDKISLKELKEMTKKMFGGMVKAVVDIDQEIVAIDAPMHADQEAFLIANGSSQENLWGINLYPDKKNEDFIEFDSMINIRPTANNRSRGVDDPGIRKKIREIVNKLVEQ